jgi:hypothetical protein
MVNRKELAPLAMVSRDGTANGERRLIRSVTRKRKVRLRVGAWEVRASGREDV